MKKENKEKIFTVKVEKSKIKEIDKFAKKMNMNRSQLIRNLVDTGIDDLKIMNSTGLLTLSLRGVDGLKRVKELFLEKKFKVDIEGKTERIIFEL
jgi:hypothetical protein